MAVNARGSLCGCQVFDFLENEIWHKILLKMAISRDLGRVRRRAYTHFEAEIRGFRLI